MCTTALSPTVTSTVIDVFLTPHEREVARRVEELRRAERSGDVALIASQRAAVEEAEAALADHEMKEFMELMEMDDIHSQFEEARRRGWRDEFDMDYNVVLRWTITR